MSCAKRLLVLALPLIAVLGCDQYSYVNVSLKLDASTGWTAEKAYSIYRTRIDVSGADQGTYGVGQPLPRDASVLLAGKFQLSTVETGTLTFDVMPHNSEGVAFGAGSGTIDIDPGKYVDLEVSIACQTTLTTTIHLDNNTTEVRNFCE